jgi:tRNA uridine 5-carboxymethylaminomethyl modification enzyme
MFTSRAEHRLMLRQDCSDEKLMEMAFGRGLVPENVMTERLKKWESKKKYKDIIHATKITPEQWDSVPGVQPIRQTTRLDELLKRPDITIRTVEHFLDEKINDREIELGIQSDIKYDGFIEKERQEIEKFRAMENAGIPEYLNYEQVEGLLLQTRTKLNTIKPRSLGQASRIPGVTPADISVLMVYLSKNNLVSRGTVEV